ncbi:unnamed protein product [Linum tenue]|uniref:RING-type E3 ubiquitin transferase n=1 Tax=Linum tenue TaxID=586396 RepID=A0AAV0J6U9_9ROSI|nr:unnamed protein product [Linum tenue]
MEISLLKVLLNNISSFSHLSSFENVISGLVQKYFQKTEEILKLLKPILDSVVDCEIASNEMLNKAFAELSQSIDELRELFVNWQPLSSKVFLVLQTEPLLSKIRSLGLEIFQFLKSANEHLPEELSSSSLEYCIQKLKQMGVENTSSTVKEGLKDQEEGAGTTGSDILVRIAESLSLRTNQEILIEAVALEKLKETADQAEKNGEVEFFDQLIALVTRMHDRLLLIKQSETSSPVPIPPDFCCPLSLELMTDPVIVASGQTYERAFIKNWIELGLTVCPKTRHTLAHTNLIPNYTVKALIANWCELNNVKLPVPVKSSGDDASESLEVPNHLIASYNSDTSGEVKSEMPRVVSSAAASNSSLHREPEFSPRFVETRSRSQPFWRRPSDRLLPRIVSSPTTETRADLSGLETQVKKLVEDLNSDSIDTQREATGQLRLLAKHNMDNRIVISNCGAITLLVNLLRSTDLKIQENAVTALLNLSINDNNKTAIANAEAIEPLIYVLETGSHEAKENSAATLFSLSVIEENKVRIGRSGAIGPLVDLLGNGTPRGKKDAATALFNLSIFHENKARIVAAGAVKHLVELMDPAAGMVDKAVAVLANLATIPEGRNAIGQQGGIPVLVEVVELGSARGKENAAAALLQLCTNSNRFCNNVLQEGAVPPLVALSQNGTPRAKEKAQSLLSHFRNQRHGNPGRN